MTFYYGDKKIILLLKLDMKIIGGDYITKKTNKF